MRKKGVQINLELFKKNVTINRLQLDSLNISLESNSSIHITYCEFVEYFRKLKVIKEHNLILGISIAYSWMPTIFKFRTIEFKEVLHILNSAMKGQIPSEKDLNILRKCFNESLVGTSKLLHFVNPNDFAIWDSRVYHYLTKMKPYSYRLSDCKVYLDYLKFCKYLTNRPEFKEIHKLINRKIGYKITPFRSVELIMYLKG